MAPGQLSPFPSCASGLGFMTAPDSHNAASLLTPTASVCTISSLAQGDGDAALSAAHARARGKTMQTKEILKSPQPHRFHLVLSGRRRTPELPSLPSRPSAQWKEGPGVPASPGCSDGVGMTELQHARQDLFSPAASPLMPPADIYVGQYLTHSPGMEDCSDYAGPTGALEEHEEACEVGYPAFTYSSRPTSTASASFTLVQDRTSKRLSAASGTIYKDMFSHDYQVAPLDEKLTGTSPDDGNNPMHDIVEAPAELHASPPPPILMLDHSFEYIAQIPEAETLPSIYSGDGASQADISQTTSGTLDSLASNHNCSSAYTGCNDDVSTSGRDSVEMSRPADTLSEAVESSPMPSSPTKPTSARDRRKFALRRQAIYAEYGFQIALPDSGSDSSVKILANSPSKNRKGRPQMRAASAYVPHSGSSRSGLSTSTSGESQPRSTAGADGEEDEMQLFGSANDVDRIGRFSVQEDIMAATRNPLLEDRAEMRTSTPVRTTKSGVSGQRSLLAYPRRGSGSVSGLGFNTGSPGAHFAGPSDLIWRSGSSTSFGPGDAVQDDSPWAPLRIRKRKLPAHSEVISISVSVSERNARLSAWEIDQGHHPLLQDLLDEVDRALEQWTWIAQLRAYRYV